MNSSKQSDSGRRLYPDLSRMNDHDGQSDLGSSEDEHYRQINDSDDFVNQSYNDSRQSLNSSKSSRDRSSDRRNNQKTGITTSSAESSGISATGGHVLESTSIKFTGASIFYENTQSVRKRGGTNDGLGRRSIHGFSDTKTIQPEWLVYLKDSTYAKCLVAAAILVVVSLVGILVSFAWSKSQPSATLEEQFLSNLQDIKLRFPSQHRRLWAIVRSSIKDVLKQRSPPSKTSKSSDGLVINRPAVILFVNAYNDELGSRTLNCLVRNISLATNQLYKPTKLADRYIDYDCRKWQADQLDGKIRRYFQENTNRVTVLRNINSLSNEAALLLHSFCDTENAPYTDAVMYLTVKCAAAETTVGNEKIWDSTTEECLREAWLSGGLQVDNVGALLSRVANSVVFVTAEPTVSC